MKPTFFFFLLLLLLAPALRAVDPTDLGSNLTYLRVHSLAEAAPSLPAALAIKRACVLDLRYVSDADGSLSVLQTALAGRPADTRLFVLVSPSTPAGIADLLTSTAPGAPITLGVVGSRPTPRITVRTDAITDRQAFDAFDRGTPITELVSGKIEKDRYDEATLVQEFKNGNVDPEPLVSIDPSKLKAVPATDLANEAENSPAAPLHDRVLQRTLHLHQALLALRR